MAERLIDANKLPVKQINIGGPMLPRWISVVYADDIDAAPTITPESLVRRGRWIYGTVRGERVPICSECRRDTGISYEYDYCPNCGAKMDLEDHQKGGNRP